MKKLLLAGVLAVGLIGCGNDKAAAPQQAERGAPLSAMAFDTIHLQSTHYLALPGRIVGYSLRPAGEQFNDRFIVKSDNAFIALEEQVSAQLESFGYTKRITRNDPDRLVVRYTLKDNVTLTADYRPDSDMPEASQLVLSRPAAR